MANAYLILYGVVVVDDDDDAIGATTQRVKRRSAKIKSGPTLTRAWEEEHVMDLVVTLVVGHSYGLCGVKKIVLAVGSLFVSLWFVISVVTMFAIIANCCLSGFA